MIGFATIGQSPREDVVSSMFEGLPTGLIRQAGALDGISPRDIQNLAPGPSDHPLVTRLRNGDEVVVAKPKILPLLDAAIRRLDDEGVDIICVLCTGEFHGLGSRSTIVYPDKILRAAVDQILPTGILGLMVPTVGQADMMRAKWARPGREIVIAAVSPYSKRHDVGTAAAGLEAEGTSLIVLDCMGYTSAMRERARHVATVPVILANGLVGAMLRAMAVELGGRHQESMLGQPADG